MHLVGKLCRHVTPKRVEAGIDPMWSKTNGLRIELPSVTNWRQCLDSRLAWTIVVEQEQEHSGVYEVGGEQFATLASFGPSSQVTDNNYSISQKPQLKALSRFSHPPSTKSEDECCSTHTLFHACHEM